MSVRCRLSICWN